MEKTDVLIIGSSAAGFVAATTVKSVNKDKRVIVVRKEKETLVPCGIPYIFSSVETTDKNILPSTKVFKNMGIELIVDEVVSIDKDSKNCTLKNGEKIEYDKLVIATGSTPIKPNWLKGGDLKNVFTVPKDKVYLDAMQNELKDAKKIVTVGAGFIGIELSDELNKDGKDVLLIEKQPEILSLAFDNDISVIVEKILTDRGVKIEKGVGVKEIVGDGKVEAVILDDGRKIEADGVILTVGYKPNSVLAEKAGLAVNKNGFIKVDEYMRTDTTDIFATGDCAEKRDFVTRKPCCIMLASTACAEARIAGINLFKLSAIKTFSGTISIFSTAIGDTGFGVAGLTESRAKKEGFDVVTGVFEGMDKHPGSLEGTHKQMVKLVVGKESGIILGGEVMGGLSAGELVNTLGFIIQNRMDVNSILTAQIGTHPLLTASPAGYPLLKAAANAMNKIRGL